MFGLSPHELSIIHYSGMALVKLVVICFFFFPWAAIRRVLRKAEGATVRLVIDGLELSSAPLSDVVHLSKQSGAWSQGEWKSDGLAKRHGLQGPIGDAFNSRFLAVYGEGDRDLAIEELDAVRNPIGPFDVHGDFPMKAAAKLTPEDVASSNLILFGTQQSNGVLRRIAPSLPAALLGTDSIFVYPNPENPSRYVVVWSTRLLGAADPGLRAGWTPPLNLLPDYVQVKDSKIVAGGHFDSNWKTVSPSGSIPRRSTVRRS